MSTQILATKLYIPQPRPKVILRPQLVELLNEGMRNKLTLISAPAGYGKTTLVSQWVSECERPVAWLSLDEGDNDPARFLAYLVAALQTVAENIGENVLGLLQSAQPPPIESMLTALLNEITTVPDNFILVLDDYHVIDAKQIDKALTFLLEHLPPQMQLVIATREDPLLPLPRSRARGQLTELRAMDLRFNSSEAAGFLNQMMALNLSADDVAALEIRTEGWIAGLQLAAISMQGHKNTANFIKSFTGSHHFVMDYLVEEVLQQQSEYVQNFLLCTSILDRLCGPLCDAVLLDSSASGQEILEYIENGNLFIVPLDNERRWYRYHHLFADLLRQRLNRHIVSSAGNEGSVAEFHSRASVWYEDNGQEVEAIDHAIAAKGFERAADLIELAWPAMERSFQIGTWLSLVKLIPDEMVRRRPVLCAGYGMALMSNGDYEAGETRLRDAERWLEPAGDMSELRQTGSSEMVFVDEEQFRSLPASIATTRLYSAGSLGDSSGAVKYARQALVLLPEGDHTRRGVAAGLLACSYWANGELDAAYQTFIDCRAGHQIAGNPFFAIAISVGLADIKVAQGRLREAVSIYEQSIQFATEWDESVTAVTADLYLGLGLLQLERGNLKTSIQDLQTSKELGDQAELVDWRYRWYVAQAQIKKTQGDLDSALDLLNDAERLFIKSPRPNLRPIVALKIRVWIVQGRLNEALVWVQEQGLTVNDELSYLSEFEHITLARVLIAEYKRDRSESSILHAKSLLARLLKEAEEGGRMGGVIEILVLQALAHDAMDDIPLALVPLERALVLAEPEGYVRIFVDEGRPMTHLLSKTTAHETMAKYMSKLLAAFETPALSAQPLVEPLSQRELEVLHLIAQGLSNQEICQRLFLALSTVKGHNRNIFGKLQVQRRTEAIARARELGLL